MKLSALRIFILLPFFVFCYLILFLIFYNLLKYDTVYPYESLKEFFINFINNFFPILAVVSMNYWVIFYFVPDRMKSLNYYLKIGIEFLISMLILVLVNYSFLWIGKLFNPAIKLNWTGTLLNSILVFMVLQIIYFVVHSYNTLKNAEEARRLSIQYQYDALKAQVNPHFLFNSLNILYSLISIDPKKSGEFVLSLSKMYRYIINQQNKSVILLSEELEFLKSYVEILEMRYHQQFKVEIIGEKSTRDVKIIPYTLQLLTENVTKHNEISSKNPMILKIEIGDEFLKISNPILKRETSESNSVGLKYIQELYKAQGKHFEIENNGITFTAKVPFL